MMEPAQQRFDNITASIKKAIKAPLFPYALLFTVCVLTYLPTIHNQFKIDDFTYINPDLRPPISSLWGLFTTSTNQHYNPLNILFNDIFFFGWGQNVVPFRVLNIFLFFLNTAFFYQICKLIFRQISVCLVSALFFCLHPVNAEIVNQIVFNTVLISALFFQMSFLSFDRFLVKKRKRDGLSAVFLATLAFLTLETTWILTLYVFLWAGFYRKLGFRKALLLTIPYWVLSAGFLLIWYLLSQGNSLTGGMTHKFAYLDLSLATFIGSLTSLIVWYIQKLIVPIDHIWIYALQPLPFKTSLIYSAGLIVFIAGCAVFVFKKLISRDILAALFLFFSGFVFIIPGSLTHPAVGLVVEPYWFYLSSMGFFMLLGIIFLKIRSRYSLRLVSLIVMLLLAVYFVLTQRMNQIAISEKSYSEYWMRVSPNPIPLTALAKIAYEEKDLVKSKALYQEYLKRFGSSLYAMYHADDLYASIGGLEMELGNFASARRFLSRALEMSPKMARAHHLLAVVNVHEQKYPEAEEHYLAAISYQKDNILDKVNLADLYLLTEQAVKAIPLLQELTAVKVTGNDRRNIFAKLAVLQFVNGDPQASAVTVSSLLRIDPGLLSYLVLGQAFEAFEQNDRAVEILEDGLRNYPGSQELKELISRLK